MTQENMIPININIKYVGYLTSIKANEKEEYLLQI